MKETRKRLLALFLTLTMVLGMFPVSAMALEGEGANAPSAWDGSVDTSWYNTTDTEFTLTTPAQLAGLAAIVNGTAQDIASDNFSGKTVKLGADITLNTVEFSFDKDTARVKVTDGVNSFYVASAGKGVAENAPTNTYGYYYANQYDKDASSEATKAVSTNRSANKVTCNGLTVNVWIPIGTNNVPFSGNFDGQNHEIHGLYVNPTTWEWGTKYQAGLFHNTAGEIKNLSLNGCVIGNGGLANQVKNNLENISAEMYVMGNDKYVGGIAGQIMSMLNGQTASDLAFRGFVSSPCNKSKSGVGGITGTLFNSVGTVELKKSVNYGEVFAFDGGHKTSGVGGICGYLSSGTIDLCANRGTIGTMDQSTHNVGGVCGYSESTVSNCYNVGAVTSSTDDNCFAGGIIGNYKNSCTVKNCYNAGSVTYKTPTAGKYGSAVGNNASCTNVYYSKESYPYNAESLNGVTEKTEEEMKNSSFAVLLGNKFAFDKENKNNGYPVFSHETTRSSEKQITSFKLGGIDGVIDQDNLSILIRGYDIPLNDKKTEFEPEITVSTGASVSPASGVSAEFAQETADIDEEVLAEKTSQLPVTISLTDGIPVEVQWYAEDTSERLSKRYKFYAYVPEGTSEVTITNKIEEEVNYRNNLTIGNGESVTVNVPAYEDVLTVHYKVQTGRWENTGYIFDISFLSGRNYLSEYEVTAENGTKVTYSVMVETVSDAKEIELTDTASVAAGMTTQLEAVVKPLNTTNKTIAWSSSDTAIATVDSRGVVTGVAAGEATITAKAGSIEKTCSVTVTEFIPVTEITLEETTLTLGKRDTHTLVPVIAPANASNKEIVWTSSDETVATVDANGVVTGGLAGTATITAKTVDGDHKAECTVTVAALHVEAIDMTAIKYVAVGSQKKLTAKLTPADATNQNVIWSTSDETVATIDENGIVTGVKAGKVDITVASAENTEISKTISVDVCESYESVYDVEWAGVFNANAANNPITGKNLPTNPEKVTTVWTAEVGNGSAAIVGDYVYTFAAASGMHGFELGGEPGTLYKVNKTTGEVVDYTTVGEQFTSPLYYAYTIYGDGLIYASTPGGTVAFDPDTMDVIWERPNFNGNYPCAQFVNGYVVSNGVVYDGTTGKTSRLQGRYDYSNGAIAGKYFYVADYTGTIHAYDTETWEEFDSLVFKENGTNLQCGVAYADGKLFWGDCMAEFAYAVKINTMTGKFVDSTLQTVSIGYTTTCTPVIHGGRVYLPGQWGTNMAVIGVFDAKTMQEIYRISDKSGGKIQSTPILYVDDVSGAVYVYAQVYGGGAIKVLKDTGTDSGEYYQLVPGLAMAFEQIACDSDGALYVTDDSGILRKIAASTAQVPKFTTDIAKNEFVYNTGSKAEELRVEATVSDDGTLTYQWQKSVDGSIWTDISGATNAYYAPATSVKGSTYYRCVVKNTLAGEVTSAVSSRVYVTVVDSGEENIRVRFRLVGATLSTSGDYDLGATPPVKDSEYITWIATKTYTVPVNTTANDLLKMALADAGMRAEGIETGYTSAIYAPPVLGSYYLAEFTNGARSGWMYSVNGSHPSLAMMNYRLKNGDTMIFHYINDYSYECSDWYDRDPSYPALGDKSTWDPWLKVPDVNPTKNTPTVGTSNGTEEVEEQKPSASITPEATTNSKGEASVTIKKDELTSAVEEATKDNTAGTVVIAPEIKGDASKVTVELPKEAVDSMATTGKTDLTVKTDIATVTLPAETLKELPADGKTVSVAVEKVEDKISVEVAVDNKAVDKIGSGVVASIPAKDVSATSVLVIVDAEGNETIVKKSAVADGEITALLEGSCTVVVKDNKKEFTDTEGHWGKAAAEFASSRELFNGVGNGKFGMNTTMNRAMMATVFYNLENGPDHDGEHDFHDVQEGKYYAKPVAWAAESGVLSGYSDGSFRADAPITREQLAVMLWNYSGKPSGIKALTNSDAGNISSYAKEAMQWAVENGVMSGRANGQLDPKGAATRAEVAQMFKNYIEKVVL